jgi:polyketide cyclase/dehydrase/lipid transport protein
MRDPFYRFVTHWRVEGRCEDVADILEDVDTIPQWWRSVYRSARVIERGGAHGIGRIVEVTTKGFLPYTLRWTYHVTQVDYPHTSTLVAHGDLEGEGHWQFAQDGGDVNITYEWAVRARHPLIRRLHRLLAPLFAANHNWTMNDGLRGLRRRLQMAHSGLSSK